MNRIILNQGKTLITRGSLPLIKREFKELRKYQKAELGYSNDPLYFQKWFIHACQKGKMHIAKWLYYEMYQKMDPMSQIGVKTTFNYCKVMINEKKYPELKKWVSSLVIKSK